MTDKSSLSLLLVLGSLSLYVGVQIFAIEFRGMWVAASGLRALYASVCPYLGWKAQVNTFPTTIKMPLELPHEKAGRNYPAFPPSPLLVAAETCDAVVLRWRGFETISWPVERFVLERYPNRNDQPQWTTLLIGNLSELVDSDVHPGRKYAYRLRTICRGNVSSAYDYQRIQTAEVKRCTSAVCRSSGSLLNSVEVLNTEGLHSLGLLFACFLTVYGLMRASVMGVQGTQSRKCRLKRIKNSTSKGVAPPTVSVLPRMSSNFTSTSSRSIDGDLSQRGSLFDATSTTTIATAGELTGAPSHGNAEPSRRTPISSTFRSVPCSMRVVKEKVIACQHCGKRFGLFRKRHLCDICHSISLCRKCGYQASVDSFANARTGVQRNGNGGREMGRRLLSVSQQQQKKLKIRTICKSCCDDRYATSLPLTSL